MHVHAVEHELEGHVVVVEARDDRAGVAVVDARHRVEDVRHERRPRLEGGPREVLVGLGVPDRDDDARGDELPHRVERTGQFGGDRDLPDATVSGLQQGRDGGLVRFSEELG